MEDWLKDFNGHNLNYGFDNGNGTDGLNPFLSAGGQYGGKEGTGGANAPFGYSGGGLNSGADFNIPNSLPATANPFLSGPAASDYSHLFFNPNQKPKPNPFTFF